MKPFYYPSFEERIENAKTEIRLYMDIIRYAEANGDTERAGSLYDDVHELEKEIEDIKKERDRFNQLVGYDD